MQTESHIALSRIQKPLEKMVCSNFKTLADAISRGCNEDVR